MATRVFNPSGPAVGESARNHKQAEEGVMIRQVIKSFFEARAAVGMPAPTIPELLPIMGRNSTSTAQRHLQQLVREGVLAQHRGKYYLAPEAASGQG